MGTIVIPNRRVFTEGGQGGTLPIPQDVYGRGYRKIQDVMATIDEKLHSAEVAAAVASAEAQIKQEYLTKYEELKKDPTVDLRVEAPKILNDVYQKNTKALPKDVMETLAPRMQSYATTALGQIIKDDTTRRADAAKAELEVARRAYQREYLTSGPEERISVQAKYAGLLHTYVGSGVLTQTEAVKEMHRFQDGAITSAVIATMTVSPEEAAKLLLSDATKGMDPEKKSRLFSRVQKAYEVKLRQEDLEERRKERELRRLEKERDKQLAGQLLKSIGEGTVSYGDVVLADINNPSLKLSLLRYKQSLDKAGGVGDPVKYGSLRHAILMGKMDWQDVIRYPENIEGLNKEQINDLMQLTINGDPRVRSESYRSAADMITNILGSPMLAKYGAVIKGPQVGIALEELRMRVLERGEDPHEAAWEIVRERAPKVLQSQDFAGLPDKSEKEIAEDFADGKMTTNEYKFWASIIRIRKIAGKGL